MIEQQAQVVRLEDARMLVRVGAGSGCSACDRGKGCGAGVFGKLLKRKPVTLSFSNDCNARVGQAVIVGITETIFLRLVFRLYGLPVLAALAGAVFGHQIAVAGAAGAGLTDSLALVFALLFAGLMLWHSRRKLAPGTVNELNEYNVKLLGPADSWPGKSCQGQSPGETNIE